MAASHKAPKIICLLSVLIGLSFAAGCGAPPATVELISVAQKALADAAEFQSARHAEHLRQLDGTLAALDAAFDADVELAEAGKITDSTGKPVELSAEWVISARKGYAAGRDALAEQRRRLEAAHATHQDNLVAAAEALGLAKDLIIQHSSLSARAKQLLTSLQRRFINDRRQDQ